MNTHYKSAWSVPDEESHTSSEPTQNVQPAKPSAAMKKPKKSQSAFRTISEVAHELKVQQHVLRFWETKFSQVKPLKRGGGRRYYRPEDVELLKTIHTLLYTEGYTIKGVQKLLKEQGKNRVVQNNKPQTQQPSANEASQPPQKTDETYKKALEVMLDELKELRQIVRGE